MYIERERDSKLLHEVLPYTLYPCKFALFLHPLPFTLYLAQDKGGPNKGSFLNNRLVS